MKLNEIGEDFYRDIIEDGWIQTDNLLDVIDFQAAEIFQYQVDNQIYDINTMYTTLIDIEWYCVAVSFEYNSIIVKDEVNKDICSIPLELISNIYFNSDYKQTDNLEIYFELNNYLVYMSFETLIK